MKISFIFYPVSSFASEHWKCTLQCLLNQGCRKDELEFIFFDFSELAAAKDLCHISSGSYLTLPRSKRASNERNQAVAISTGEILLFIEEPFVLPDDYCTSLYECFNPPYIAAVQTRIISQEE